MAPSNPETRLADRFERFLFAPVDPYYAAVFRILLAAALAGLMWPRGLGLRATGYKPDWLVEMYDRVFLTMPYWAVILVGLVAFGFGVKTRVTGPTLVALLLPLSVLRGAHVSGQIMVASLLVFSLVRNDARLSVWPSRRGTASGSAGPIWPIRLIQFQLCLLYGVNALAKTKPGYLSGDVLVGLSRMHPNFLGEFTDRLVQLGPVALPVGLAALLSVATEYFLAIGFWFRRLRWIAAAVGILFHMTVTQVVEIFMLDWAAIFLYLSFLLPFERWASDGGRTHQRESAL